MSRYVADAGIVVKWFVDEDHAEEAKRLRRPDFELHVPDQMFAEVGNVLWKKCRAGELTQLDAVDILDTVGRYRFTSHASWPLVVAATDVAFRAGIAVYDGLYVALALALDCELVTADRRLFDAVQGTDAESYVTWVADLRSF